MGSEMKACLDQIREDEIEIPKRCWRKAQQKQEESQEKEVSSVEEQKFVIGETIQSILKKVGVQLADGEELNDLIKRLPLPGFIGRKIKILKKNPQNIDDISQRIALMFGVDEESLKSEMKSC